MSPTKKKTPLKKKAASKPNSGLAQIKRVRQICLALPETSEKISHSEPTFFVRKRVFCMFANNHHNDGHIGVWVAAEPAQQATLLKEEPQKYYYPPFVGKGGWIGIELAQVSDDELGGHLSDAWRLIEAKQKKPSSRRKDE